MKQYRFILKLSANIVYWGDCDRARQQQQQFICTELFLFVVKHGTPTDDELEDLSDEIAENWIKLGRRLRVSDLTIQEINKAHDQLSEKGYHMLKHWKQERGSAAT